MITRCKLIDTLVFYVGMCFVLRSGEKHRRHRYHPAQIELVEPVGGIPYLMYREDVSKTNQGGIQHRKVENKKVVRHVNEGNPERCLVWLYKLYQSRCPPGRPNEAFYLKPLKNQRLMFGLDVLILDIMFWEIPFVVSLNVLKYPGFI